LLFNVVSSLTNVVGASWKRGDLICEKQYSKIVEAFNNGDISRGRGLHQETMLRKADDTCWDSYYGSLVNLIILFSSITTKKLVKSWLCNRFGMIVWLFILKNRYLKVL
jgi:hypothetical protein